ncbi:MAG: hypothetical protein WB791_03375 [Waddliaceae bacterium]
MNRVKHLLSLSNFRVFFLISLFVYSFNELSSCPNYYYYSDFNYQKYRNFSVIHETEQREKIEAYLKRSVPALKGDSFRDVIDAITAKNFEAYIVGGMIRDLLSLNPAEPRDIDLRYTGSIEELKDILDSHRWPYTHLPGRHYVIIGDHRGTFMDAVSIDTSSKNKIDDGSDEFTINNIFYHCNTRSFAGNSKAGLEDFAYDRLRILAKDWKAWLYEDTGHRHYLIFRFWKMVGKGYVYSTEMADFFIHETEMIFKDNHEEFHEQLLHYLGSHYEAFDEIYRGCLAIMGYDWTHGNFLSFKDEIEQRHEEKTAIRDKYTTCLKANTLSSR